MEFDIPDRNLKLFATTLKRLKKLGDDLGIEGKEDKVIFRVLNMSRSAFACVTFHKTFFGSLSFKIRNGALPSLTGLTCKCQTKLQAWCSVFKTQIAKIEKCVCVIDQLTKQVQIELLCKPGVRKRFSICFDDNAESLEAKYNSSMPSRLVVQPGLMAQCLSNFHKNKFSLDELTLTLPRFMPMEGGVATSVPIQFKSAPSLLLNAEAINALSTELGVDSASFDEYVVSETTTLSLSMEDFRDIVSLCEFLNVPMTIQLSKAGQPIVVTTQYLNLLEATFVVATIFEQGRNQQSSSDGSTAAGGAQEKSRHSDIPQRSSDPSSEPVVKHSGTQLSPPKYRAKEGRDEVGHASSATQTPPMPPEPLFKDSPPTPSRKRQNREPMQQQLLLPISSKKRERAGAVVYGSSSSGDTEEHARLRDMQTTYGDDEMNDNLPSPPPPPSDEQNESSTLPAVFPNDRLFLGDTKVHLREIFPTRSQINGSAKPGPGGTPTNHQSADDERNAMIDDDDNTVPLTGPM